MMVEIMSRCEPLKTKNTASNNRAEFPACAAILDEFRAEFGPGVKLVYGIEVGKSIGKKPVATKRYLTVDQWLRCSVLIGEELERREAKPMFDHAGKINKRGRS
jgi:hypothetical protein